MGSLKANFDFCLVPMTQSKFRRHKEDKKKPKVPNPNASKYISFQPYLCRQKPKSSSFTYGYKITGDIKVIKNTLEFNGFKERKSNWVLFWGSGGLRSNVYASLSRWQKVNHFPRSHEITKKDSLFKNLAKMQSLHGARHFDFIPETYVLPNDKAALEEAMRYSSEKWIFKPAAKSQGKGIFVSCNSESIPSSHYVASKYIDNPLLINSLKFDLRIYAVITSIDPLRIYVYKEGLVRFATAEYKKGELSNRFMHLTNYSVNKLSPCFRVSSTGQEGHKWTLEALKKYFQERNIDFLPIWSRIKEIIVKTIISIENKMHTGAKMFVPYRTNCFELLGFDILLDDSYKPWLLEVNLSPSLNVDSSVDLNTKAHLVCDMFNLIGIAYPNRSKTPKRRPSAKPAWDSCTLVQKETKFTPHELSVLRETEEEFKRAHNFERVFPSEFSHMYRNFFEEERNLNLIVCGEWGRAKRCPNKDNLSAFQGNAYVESFRPLTKGALRHYRTSAQFKRFFDKK